MKWLGSILIFCGGFWWRQLQLGERRQQRQTVERLLGALYQLREGIRMARLPLPQLLEQLAAEERFFEEVLRMLRTHEELPAAWEGAMELLQLPHQSCKAWRWLGGRLIGDEQYVLQAMAYVESILEQERQRLEAGREEHERRTTAVCFSTAALLVILLL